MTVNEAIKEAVKTQNWQVTENEPTSVEVWFLSKSHPHPNNPDNTQLDLYEKDKAEELAELWESLAEEYESGVDKIVAVEAYGKIL